MQNTVTSSPLENAEKSALFEAKKAGDDNLHFQVAP